MAKRLGNILQEDGTHFSALATKIDQTGHLGHHSNASVASLRWGGRFARNRWPFSPEYAIVHGRDDELDLPSDLAGVTATFAKRAGNNVEGSNGPVCTAFFQFAICAMASLRLPIDSLDYQIWGHVILCY
jgi:hypothetical protein